MSFRTIVGLSFCLAAFVVLPARADEMCVGAADCPGAPAQFAQTMGTAQAPVALGEGMSEDVFIQLTQDVIQGDLVMCDDGKAGANHDNKDCARSDIVRFISMTGNTAPRVRILSNGDGANENDLAGQIVLSRFYAVNEPQNENGTETINYTACADAQTCNYFSITSDTPSGDAPEPSLFGAAGALLAGILLARKKALPPAGD